MSKVLREKEQAKLSECTIIVENSRGGRTLSTFEIRVDKKIRKQIFYERQGCFPSRRSMDHVFYKPHELAARVRKERPGNYL
jgi:hypothetical protein